jgi:cell pole-organizing protein PopZ
MSQPAKAQEPSMEEILASIRRIIADDDSAKPAAKPAAAAVPPPAPKPVAPPPPSPPKAAEPPRPAPAPPASTSMSQSDIDAMLAGRSSPPPPPPPAPEPEPQEDILELTEAMAEQPESSFRTIDGQPDVVFADPAPEPPQPAYEEARRSPPPPPIDRGLLSSRTHAAVDSAFNSLAHTVLVQNARTLEDLVKEMLRPMLKSWLDDNLPSMVERIVRAEIERVSRGSRG